MVASAKSKLRIWIDITNSPHVLVFRPIINLLKEQGHELFVTSREFAQVNELLKRFGIDHHQLGAHQGKEAYRKAYGLIKRTGSLIAYAAGKNFSLSIGHGSNDCALASGILRIPHVTMFDYEHARVMHSINLRVSAKALVPDVIPSESLYRYGGKDQKIDKYPGLKEEYYLADFEPDGSVIDMLGLDINKIIVVMRTPPELALYHRLDNPIFEKVLQELGSRNDVELVVLPRTKEQKEHIRGLGLKSVVIPDKAIDAQSLIYYADLVISAGGTMNREATALNTNVYTIFSGRMGAVDNRLIAGGKMTRLTEPGQIILRKKSVYGQGRRRDVGLLVEKMLEVL